MHTQNNEKISTIEIFTSFLRLGFTAFGGPLAHLGFFRETFVIRKKWISDSHYADLVALCQFLPGPSSSQVGLSIGLLRGGYSGALAAWLGFTLPSAILMILFALSISGTFNISEGILHGLKIAAVAVVAQAIWGMATSLCPDKTRRTIAIVAACVVLSLSSTWTQIGVIMASGIAGLFFCRHVNITNSINSTRQTSLSRKAGIISLSIFFSSLFILPLLVNTTSSDFLTIINSYFHSGSLVFGGGHVVLPLLETETVRTGWVSADNFMAGYGIAQAIPGPLFTFAAFLGAISSQSVTGWGGGLLALFTVFLPSFLLVFGVLPFWHKLCQYKRVRYALAGINAGVVGLLLAAFYSPVWTSSISQPTDFGLTIVTFAALMWWRCPSWFAVLCCALAGYFI